MDPAKFLVSPPVVRRGIQWNFDAFTVSKVLRAATSAMQTPFETFTV